jgi:hypothetical protein
MLLRARLALSFWSQAVRVLALALAVLVSAGGASRAASDSSGPAGGSVAAKPEGLGVVAFPGATEVAWPLAQALYAEPSLRPLGLDEAMARVMCGEAAPSGSPAPRVDLAAAVAALRGDDAPSRILLGEIARRASARALVTIRISNGHPLARVFLPETGSFDAAAYAPDESPQVASSATQVAWSATVKSLVRVYAAPPAAPSVQPAQSAPALATREAPPSTPAATHSRPFYDSPWLWIALGAAAVGGGIAYLVTNPPDTSPSRIHLELKVH